MRLMLLAGIILYCLSCSTSKGQSNNHSEEKYPLVEVMDWSSKSMIIVDEVWPAIKDQIVSQIGEEGYNDVKAHCSWKSVPKQMVFMRGQPGPIKTLKEHQEKLALLKGLYRVATYRHIFQGKDWGERSIIKVPYEGNEDWDKDAKWDTVYFILKSEDIRLKDHNR